MKKRILACMLIVAMVGIGVVFAAEASDTIENLGKAGAGGNTDTKLNLTWEFNDTKETYKVGFSSVDPGRDLSNKSYTDTLEITPYGQNNDSLYKGIAETWIYWDIYTNKAFKIEMSASGPLKMGIAETSKTDYNDLINWTASWVECQVLQNGEVKAKDQAPSVLGRADNDFATMEYTSDNAAYGGKIDPKYTTAQIVYNQLASSYDVMGKKGAAHVTIETQNTRAEEVKNKEKLPGTYAASLQLKISSAT